MKKVSKLIFPLLLIITTVVLYQCKVNDAAQITSAIKPPIEGLKVNNSIFLHTPNKETIYKTKKGSEVIIPANAIVYLDGSEVKEKVEIDFSEFHSMADIALSGIPMQYNNQGETTNFISGGMFSIRGKTVDGQEVKIKENESIRVNLASSKEGDFDLFQLNEQTGEWILLKDTIEEIALNTEFKLPQVPKKVTSEDVILDINITKISDTYGFESSLWKLVGDLSEKDKKRIAQTNWTKYDIQVVDEKLLLYELTVIKGIEVVKAKVNPVLSPADRNKCEQKVAQQIAEMKQDLTNNYYEPKVMRGVNIRGFGTVNCDVFVVEDQSLVASYEVEGVSNKDISFVHFDLTRDFMINVSGKKLRFKPESKNVLVALLPNQEVALFTPSQYKELDGLAKGSKVNIKFKKIERVIHSAEDLQRIIASYY